MRRAVTRGLVWFVVLGGTGFAQSNRTLELGRPVERELSATDGHSYTLDLAENQIAHVVADQRGVDIVLSVVAPDGTKLFDVDSANGAAGEETAAIAARQRGTYRVDVRAIAPGSAAGKYRIRLAGFLSERELLVERLAGLARVWAAAKFFHPFLAYREIDWDGALINAIPAVKAARSPREYLVAVNSMLRALDDTATTAEIFQPEASATIRTGSPPQTRPGFHVVDGFVVVHGIDLAETIGNLGPAVVLNSQAAMLAAIEKSNGIVIDCRYGEAAAPPLYFLDFYLRTVLPFFVTGSVPLGSQRYRQHNGYAAQGGASGGYSLLVTRAPDVIVGRAQIKKPLAVLIDARSSGLLPVWSGLQAAGAKIVVIGEASERVNSYRLSLPEGVRVNLRVAEFVSPAGESIFQPDVRLASEANTADQAVLAAIGSLQRSDQTGASSTRAVAQALKGQYDNPYPEMRFPPEEYRLLALFRFWSVINYFYPYKQLTDKPWDTVLTDFIPMFLDNKSALDYQTTVAQMAARMQDSHGSVRGLEELDNHLGMFAPPVRLASAGGQVVVVALPDAAHAADLRLGDVILNIDGEPVSQRIAALATLRSLSTPQAAYDFIYPALLRGARDTAVELRVIGTDGRARQVTVARSVPLTSVSGMMPRRTPVYQVLPNGYGYIDLARLLMPDVTKAMDAVMDTPALIFDMRGYPNGTGLALVQRLNDRPNVTNALFRRPFQEAINLDNLNFGGGAPDYAFEQELPRGAGTAYKGRVVMLINEFAISQAEHICMAFESATNVTFIGGPTNGADGGVTNMVLPGAIYVTFTGDDVRHGDGRQLQRIGIQPMIKVEPTPRGIGEGRDEVMEAAIRYLETTPRK